MLGSIDYMHWTWKNYPKTYQDIYCGKSHDPKLSLRQLLLMIYGFDIAFFVLPSSLNDINVLHRSHLLARLASGDAPTYNYTVNGHDYTMGYYLVDGIYSEWLMM